MSFTPRNLAPGALFMAGVILLVLGYVRTGLVLILAPILLGIGVLIWAMTRKDPG